MVNESGFEALINSHFSTFNLNTDGNGKHQTENSLGNGQWLIGNGQ